MLTVGADIDVAKRGGAQIDARAEVRRRIAHAARGSGTLVAELRVRLSPQHPTGLVCAQANAYADGHPVRIQVVAATLPQAMDALVERAVRRLSETMRAWTPRAWPDPGRASTPAPDPGARGRIARIKACALAECRPEVAAATMDAMDYDIHLFTDAEAGCGAVVYRRGPTGYRLAYARATGPSRRARWPLALDPHPAPSLTTQAAAARLDATGQPYLFFTDTATGRGQVLYRRHDARYALITGAV
jgi:hypothetical protein